MTTCALQQMPPRWSQMQPPASLKHFTALYGGVYGFVNMSSRVLQRRSGNLELLGVLQGVHLARAGANGAPVMFDSRGKLIYHMCCLIERYICIQWINQCHYCMHVLPNQDCT